MSLIKHISMSLFVLGALTYTQIAQADCERNEKVLTTKLNMDVGRVIISPDAKVGDVILKREFTNSGNPGFIYTCDSVETVVFTGKLVNPGEDMGDNVYSTNIPGVGIRLSRGGSTVNFTYPGEFRATSKTFTLEGSKFRLELIKTGEITGGGSLASGVYSTYSGPSGTPLLETYLSGNGITVVSPSCKLLSSPVMRVDLPTTLLENFSGVGSTLSNKDFSIDLLCSGGVSISGSTMVSASFSGNQPVGYAKSTGVLVNEDTSGNSAKGIGFLVKTGGKAVAFDEKYLIDNVNDESETKISLPMSASYYQYDSSVSAGRITSHMTYNITYD